MIYLVDNIGNETGVHLYNSMFYENFKKVGKDVLVLSNYEDTHTKRLVWNFYHGNTAQKILNFGISLIRLLVFSMQHKNEIFIYQSFGLRKIDQFFIQAIRVEHKYVLVHDIFDIKDSSNTEINKKKIVFYKRYIKNVICHSEKTERDLRDLGFEGKIVYFPHPQYNYDEQMNKYDGRNVGPDVKQSIIKDRINILFFGQVRESKGIDIVLGCLKYLKNIANINIIIAGTDKQHLVNVEETDLLKTVLRYINNDEMMYLYNNCNYVLLPYKEVYQSGVMESMLYFKKPGIMSDVEYFSNIGREYPSFGIVYSPNEANALSNVIIDISNGKYNQIDFYSDRDVKKYDDSHDIKKIIETMF